MFLLTPRPDVTKREGSPCPRKWGSLASDSADWPLADHSAPAAKPAAPAAKPAPACFRNRLRPTRLESMIASVIPKSRIFDLSFGANELCLGPNIFANTTL